MEWNLKKLMNNKMKTHKTKETIAYKFEDGFVCYIKIDYFNNRFDIVEPIDILGGNFKKKEFTFIGRGVEYMKGWMSILGHLQEAIADAKLKYEKNLAEETKFSDKDKEDFFIRIKKK